MATNKIVENDEREENKKGIIIFIIVLILLLALFIGIRALSSKKDDKKENKEQPVEEEIEKKEIVEEQEEDTSYVYTPTKSSKVKRTSNEEEKDILTLVLKGSNVIYVEYADNYVDEGAYALDTKDGDISISVSKTIYLNGSVVDVIDTTNSGATYTIKYVVTNSRGEVKEIIRTVIIKEAEVTISLNGNSEEQIEYNTSNPSIYNDLGATAETSDGTNIPVISTITKDNEAYTGNITSDILGNYVITYTATYKEKEFTVKRNVVVEDTTAPIITTEKEMYLYAVDYENQSSEITIEEIKNLFTINDEDSNVTTTLTDSNVLEVTNINKAIVGEYTVILTATDSSNNTNAKAIVIKVKEDEAPTFETTATESASQYQIEINATDDFTESDNLKVWYAVINTNSATAITDTDWVEMDTNTLTIAKAPATAPNPSTKYVFVKVIDDNNNTTLKFVTDVSVN